MRTSAYHLFRWRQTVVRHDLVNSNYWLTSLVTHRRGHKESFMSQPVTLIRTKAVNHVSWCSVYKGHLHIQVNFTYIKIGGHVSNEPSGGTSERKKIMWVHFSACKTEWTKWLTSFMQSLSLLCEKLLQTQNSSVLLKLLYIGCIPPPPLPPLQRFVGKKSVFFAN